MNMIAPNISSILGTALTARLLTKVGGLKTLAKMPSQNIMVSPGSAQHHMHVHRHPGLSIYLASYSESIYLSSFLSRSVYLESTYLSVCVSICLCVSIYLESIYLSLSIYLYSSWVYLSISIYLGSICRSMRLYLGSVSVSLDLVSLCLSVSLSLSSLSSVRFVYLHSLYLHDACISLSGSIPSLYLSLYLSIYL